VSLDRKTSLKISEQTLKEECMVDSQRIPQNSKPFAGQMKEHPAGQNRKTDYKL